MYWFMDFPRLKKKLQVGAKAFGLIFAMGSFLEEELIEGGARARHLSLLVLNPHIGTMHSSIVNSLIRRSNFLRMRGKCTLDVGLVRF